MNEEVITTVLYLAMNVFSVWIIRKMFRLFFNEQRTPMWVEIISYVIYFVIDSVVYLYGDRSLMLLCCNLFGFLMIGLNYKSKLLQQIIISIFIYVFLVTIETVVTVVLDLVKYNLNSDYFTFWGMFFSRISMYIIISLFVQKKNLRTWEAKSVRQILLLTVLSISILILACMLPYIGANPTLIIASTTSLCAIIMSCFHLIELSVENEKQKALKQAFEIQSHSYQHELELNDRAKERIQKNKHDMKLQLDTLYELVCNKKYDEAKHHIEGINTVIQSGEQQYQSGNIIIDSILNYKASQAKQHHIEMKINMKPVGELNIKSHDIVSIIGNLMDNAIESNLKIEQASKRYIQINFGLQNTIFYFNIQNPMLGKAVQRNGKYITNKREAKNHGYGLENVKNSVEKYDGILKVTQKTNFEVEITMYTNADEKKLR